MSSSDSEAEPGVVLQKKATEVDETGRVVFKPTREFILAFMSLMAIVLAVAFDATTLSVALPTISADLHGTALQAFWSGTSFLLASTVLQPTVAGLSHIFGRKVLIYFCVVFFAAGSLIAALAQDFTVILVGRTIQGVGGGGVIALSEVVVTDLVPLEFRGSWFALMSSMWAIGTVSGPLIGAGFSQNVSWRWLFWINLPIIGIGTVLIFFFLNQARIPGGIASKVARFDWAGSVFFTVGSTALLFGISTGGVMYGWSSWRVLLPLIIGFLVLVGFFFYEFNWAAEPIVNRRIFNNWTMIAMYIMTVFHGAILWSLLYFLTLYYQGVLFYSPVHSALAVLPETLTVAPASMVVGIVAGATGLYQWSVWAGWILATLGAGILYLLSPQSSVVQYVFINLPIGIGTGGLFAAMGLGIQAACDPALNAQAAAFYSFARTFGQSIGVAISGVIFQNAFRKKLLDIPSLAASADEFSRDATTVVQIIKAMAPGAERDTLVAAYSDSLRTIWIALTAFAGFCMLLSFSTRAYSLKQEHVTQQGLVQNGRGGVREGTATDEETANREKTDESS